MMLNSLKTLILISCVMFGFTACSSNEKLDFSKPKMQVPKPTKNVQKKKGSLYTRKGPSLFADKKDLQIGDIIQVQISESLSSDVNNKRELKRNNSTALGGGLLSASTGNTNGLGGVTRNVADKLNPLLGVNFNTSSNSSNTGEAKTKLAESFSTTVSVIIEQTYQNGNYYIRGSKEMLIDGQKQELVLSGVIRPYDITPENTVSSSQIASLKILYKKEGEEKDILHVPWGLKIIQMFWPF